MKLTRTSDVGRDVYEVDEVSSGDIGRADEEFLRFVREELLGMTFVNSFTASDFDEKVRTAFASDQGTGGKAKTPGSVPEQS